MAWKDVVRKPATKTVADLIGLTICMIADCTGVIMQVSVALFTVGLIDL